MRFIFLQTHCPSKLLNVFTFIASCLSIECTNLNSNASFGKQFSRFWLAYGDLEMRKLFQGFLTQMQRGLRMADSNSKGNPETRWSNGFFADLSWRVEQPATTEGCWSDNKDCLLLAATFSQWWFQQIFILKLIARNFHFDIF